MTDRSLPCPHDDHLVALALGELTGRERADVVAHLPGCSACQARVDDLIDTADQLLLAAPEAEPPPGFDLAVLQRVRGERPPSPRLPNSSRGLRPLAALAASVVVLAVLLVVLLPERSPATSSAEMITPSGYVVGTAWAHHGDPGLIVVSVPNWRMWDDDAVPPGDYLLEVELDGGDAATLGTITFNEADGSWGTTTALDTGRITRLAIVDDTGRTWCSATF